MSKFSNLIEKINVPMMTASVELITPHVAEKYLKDNVANRPLSESSVRNYARLMQQGNWKLTGEPIIFSNMGVLLNGQHRLSAVIMAQTPVRMLVVYGADQSVFDALDQGRKRTAGDVLAVVGEKHYNRLAAALRQYCQVTKGQENPTIRNVTSINVTVYEIERALGENPDIRKWVDIGSAAKNVIDGSTIAALGYMFSMYDENMAITFVERLADGSGLTAKHPILALRDRLILNKASKAKLRKNDVIALTIKSWNAFVQGKQIGTLKWSGDESFPRIIYQDKTK